MMSDDLAGRRGVRSFVVGRRRATRAQLRALDEHWRAFGIDGGTDPIDLDRIFGRVAPRYVEIGFGRGDALLAMASAHPQRDYLGVEVYTPGIGHVLGELAARDLSNVRVVRGDAAVVLAERLGERALAAVLVFFPDPWPKKRHHKRRLIQPAFADVLASRLQDGATLHLATDWEDYAEHMLAVLDGHAAFRNLAGPGRYSNPQPERPQTKFERRGQRLGHVTRDLVFERLPR